MSALRSTFSLVVPPLMLAALLVGCDKSPPKSEVSAAKEQTATKTVESIPISQDSSKVEFVGAKVTGKHDGSFEKFTGKIDLAPNAAVEGSIVTVDIDAASVKSDDDQLTGHLKSKDFFEVEKYPTIKFVSTQIKAGGADGATHTVTGNLALHGVEKSITFPAKIEVTPDAVSANATFTINRKDFGIVYAGMADNLIKDDVTVKLSVKGSRKKS